MKELIALMDKVQTSGAFSVSGTLPSILPGLHVKGVGHIGLPLTEHQAKALIQLSEPAPFGRGEETIVDPHVRQSWQISADDFELRNPQWNEALRAAVDQIGKELGLSGCNIGFEPYKLLVYKEGSFFASHRDTEKIPNMFATFVVNLPSPHEGGELIISHAGQSQSYSFADSSLFEPSFVAFYADCYHEVKPITAGYRLYLVYNLAITNRTKQPVLSQQMGPIEEIDHAIQAWRQETHDNPILTYLLDHSYSEQNPPGRGGGDPGAGALSFHHAAPGAAQPGAERAGRHGAGRHPNHQGAGHGHPGAAARPGYRDGHPRRATRQDFRAAVYDEAGRDRVGALYCARDCGSPCGPRDGGE